MKYCKICGNKNDSLGRYRVSLTDSVSICSNCYEQFPNYSMRDKFPSLDALKLKWLEVKDYGVSRGFSDEVLNALDTHFATRQYNYMKKYDIEITDNIKNDLASYGIKFPADIKTDNHIVSTTPSLDGYRIQKYLGIVSSEIVLGTGFFSSFEASLADTFGTESMAFGEKINKAKETCLERIKVQSASIGGNAIVGLKIDLTVFASNMVAIAMNGTSVNIEKIEQ